MEKNSKEYRKLREAIRSIIKESIDENFFTRMGAAYDTAKDKMMGMGGDIANSYKKEKAFDLYKKYRTLLTKANQMKPKVNAKAAANANYFQQSQPQARNSFQAAKAYGLSEELYTVIKESIKETCADESIWGGIKNIGRNFTKSARSANGLRDAFNNMKADYKAGDASSDAVNYSQIWSEANRAKTAFVSYCKQNGFDPKAIAQEYQSRVRQGVVSGQDNSKIGLRQATQNGKQKIKAAGPSADALNKNRAEMRKNRDDANVARVWEEDEMLNELSPELLGRAALRADYLRYNSDTPNKYRRQADNFAKGATDTLNREIGYEPDSKRSPGDIRFKPERQNVNGDFYLSADMSDDKLHQDFPYRYYNDNKDTMSPEEISRYNKASTRYNDLRNKIKHYDPSTNTYNG